MSAEHRSKYKHKRLPHWDFGEVAQTITYRLADSLSENEYNRILYEMGTLPLERQDLYKRTQIENFLHENRYGSCCLNQPEAANIVIDAWDFYDGNKYDLYAWVVMGNHVHVLIRQHEGYRLEDIIRSWKSFTSRQIAAKLHMPQPIWRDGYWNRMIRDAGHFQKVKEYIQNNPEKSGLTNWPYVSSAR